VILCARSGEFFLGNFTCFHRKGREGREGFLKFLCAFCDLRGENIRYHCPMLEWFPKSTPLESYLDKLGQPPSNFNPEQPIDPTWHVDQHEVPLGPDQEGLFARAVDLLLLYRRLCAGEPASSDS
jgi:hypothetical protein